MGNVKSSSQCEAATIESPKTTTQKLDKGKRPENVVLDMEGTSGSSTLLQNVEDDRQAKYQNTTIQLYQAAMKGDWEVAKSINDNQNGILGASITSNMDTALHIAVAAKKEVFVKNIVGEMSEADVAKKNRDGNTALYVAASLGVVEIAKMLIEKNSDLPNITGRGERTPVQVAALHGHSEMVKELYDITSFENPDYNANIISLFHAMISADIYDAALWMFHKDERNKEVLATFRNTNGETALHLMARKSSTISLKSKLNIFQNMANYICRRFYRDAKKKTLAHQLVWELWESVMKTPEEAVSDIPSSPSRLLFDAAESGNFEFLVILIRSYPDIIHRFDDRGLTIFHIAALNRHANIFNIIYDLGGIKDVIASYEEDPLDPKVESGVTLPTKDKPKNNLLHSVPPPNPPQILSGAALPKKDKPKNNLLHLVARLPSPNSLHILPGAAFQLQSELRWFKAVKEIVPRSYIKAKNNDGEVAHEIFTREHETLRKEGEKWMIETATTSILAATLIATVVFAAAFTVPGGNNQSEDNASGFPIFRGKFWFDMFILLVSVSLLLSVTSIVISLSIHTSRYAEDDFRTALPLKLVMGIFSLIVSINSMVLAFTASMILMRQEEPKWSFILISFLASLGPLAALFLFSFPIKLALS